MRRCVLTLLVLAATFVAAPSAAARDMATAYQINRAHDGWLRHDSLAPPLQRRWTRHLGGTVSYPLVANGMVYVTTATSTDAATLYALSARTGKTVWSRVIGATYAWAEAAYDKGSIYAVNTDGILVALSADSGTTRWVTDLPGQYMFSSPPVARNGRVFTGGAGSGGTVYSVRESDGKLLWTQPVENGDNSSPALSARSLFVSYACPQTYAFGLGGKLRWHYSGPCEGGGGSTPVYYDGRLYVRDSSDLVFDAVHGGLVDVFSAGPAPAFYRSTGLYVSRGALQAVSLTTDRTRWRFRGDGQIDSAPIVVNGVAYVGSASGRLYGVKIHTGRRVWRGKAPAPVLGPYERGPSMLTGLGAGQGRLIVSASGTVSAYR